MTRFSVRWAVPMLAGVALLVAGCDSPPEAEKKAADAAIAAAKSAEADKYAGPAYKAVTDLQRQADSFMSEKKYKEAKTAYERAKGLGDDAAKAAVARQDRDEGRGREGHRRRRGRLDGYREAGAGRREEDEAGREEGLGSGREGHEGRARGGEDRAGELACRGQGQARDRPGVDREVVEGSRSAAMPEPPPAAKAPAPAKKK